MGVQCIPDIGYFSASFHLLKGPVALAETLECCGRRSNLVLNEYEGVSVQNSHHFKIAFSSKIELDSIPWVPALGAHSFENTADLAPANVRSALSLALG